MYSLEDRLRAVELYIRYGHNAAVTVRELGYPDKSTLKRWYGEYACEGGLRTSSAAYDRGYTEEQKEVAVRHYLEHGKSLSRTVGAMGYPSKEGLRGWVDELAPGERRVHTGRTEEGRVEFSLGQKTAAVIDLYFREGTAAEVARKHNATSGQLYAWRDELLGRRGVDAMPEEGPRALPDDVEGLLAQIEELKGRIGELGGEKDGLEGQVRRLRMERDILEATVEIVKKDPGADPEALTNREKTAVVGALRGGHPLKALLEALDLAKSSYYYQVEAMAAPDKYEGLRAEVRREFAESGSSYGYRRIHARVTREGPAVSEKVVLRVMREEGLSVFSKRRRAYSSYLGDISPAAGNLVNRDFHAPGPNELWLTDLTEFHIPAGKVYLSPMLDCFDGKLVSWTIGTSPNAELANTMLDLAVGTLGEGEHPVVHSDQGCHYRWPGWIERMGSAGLTRSMSRKGCSPDNSACEGLFGRIKNEMFYYRSWKGVGIEEFIGRLNDYLHWYNEKRIKESLGYLSPVEYRQSLGMTA